MIYQIPGTGTNFVITADDPIWSTTSTLTVNYIVGTEADASRLLAQYRQELLEHQSYRFTACKVSHNTLTNVVNWQAMDLINDPEEHEFMVFNHNTGLHESIYGKTTATNRINELKNQFADSLKLDVLTTASIRISMLQGKTVTPGRNISQGTQPL
jgi:hypothetical protein